LKWGRGPGWGLAPAPRHIYMPCNHRCMHSNRYHMFKILGPFSYESVVTWTHMSTVLVVRGWARTNHPTVHIVLWLCPVLGLNTNMHVGARLRRQRCISQNLVSCGLPAQVPTTVSCMEILKNFVSFIF
jgi:hypothetical protein